MIRLCALLTLLSCQNQVIAAVECGVAASPLSFGIYEHLNPFSTTSQATILVGCQEQALLGLGSTLVTYSVSLDGGNTGDVSNRAMSGSTHQLHYNLYRNSSHTLVWGDQPGEQTLGAMDVPSCLLNLSGCTLVTKTYEVYGRIPAGQSIAAGIYSDTITVTVTY